MMVHIHASQYPQQVLADLLNSLRDRSVNHKFHYDTVRQTQRWLELHQAFSPSRTDQDCAATYEKAFREAARRIPAGPVRLVGLGCGGGKKDRRVIEELLRDRLHSVEYLAVDVSPAMVITACQEVAPAAPEAVLPPLVCDLGQIEDLEDALQCCAAGSPWPVQTPRLISFFGMIPNFEPGEIIPRLKSIVRAGDWLLFSANLAPGDDYEAGVRKILPQYDNTLTRRWLLQFLLDLGWEPGDGQIQFTIDADPQGYGLRRVTTRWHCGRERTVHVGDRRFDFAAGETLRLFYSYRYTPALVNELLGRHGLKVQESWVTRSGEEGVFLVTL